MYHYGLDISATFAASGGYAEIYAWVCRNLHSTVHFRRVQQNLVVIKDRGILDEIPKYHPYSQMLKNAPMAILVCGDEQLQKYKGYWVQDCSAATENILIAAQAKGLGAVWLGVYPTEDRVIAIRKLLGIPEHVIPFSLISIGYPAEQKPRSDRYDASRIHRNKW